MALEDKIKWNKRHLNSSIPNTPIKLLQKYIKQAQGKQALDIACGIGRHSKFLAQNGFMVDALDISSTAIDSLQNIPLITAKEVDFDTYKLEENKYDLIICTYFLKRSLFPQIEKALKQGGIFIFQTYIYHPNNHKIPSKRSFLLEEGELKTIFGKNYKLLHLDEWWDKNHHKEQTMKGALIVKKQ